MRGGKTAFTAFSGSGTSVRLFVSVAMCVVVFMVSGCASHKAEERLSLLEARLDGQQVYAIRLDNLEERMAALEGDVGALRARLPSGKKAPAPRIVKKSDASSATVVDAPSMRLPAELRPPTSPVASATLSSESSLPADPLGQAAIDRTIAELTTARETPPSGGVTPVKAAPGDKKAYTAALGLYEQKKYREAEKRFTEFLERYPASKLAPNAMYWYAECFYSRKEYATAIVNFKNVAAKYPKHDKAAAALYKVGLSYQQLKDTENARFYWRILQDDFPASAPARLADKQLKTA